MAGEQGGTGLTFLADEAVGAQSAAELIAAPGADYAIRIHSAEVISATGDAKLHHDSHANADKTFVSGLAGSKGEFKATLAYPFHQLPANEALKLTSTGDVSYNIQYETVYVGRKPLGGPHAL